MELLWKFHVIRDEEREARHDSGSKLDIGGQLGHIFEMADTEGQGLDTQEKNTQADTTVFTNRYEKVLLCFLRCGSLVQTSGQKKSAANKEQAKARGKSNSNVWQVRVWKEWLLPNHMVDKTQRIKYKVVTYKTKELWY